MSDLLGGASGTAGPATSNGNGLHRPIAPPAATGSPIRGPRAIMQERLERQERREREARQQAERERLGRQRAEEEARLLDEARRREAERRGTTAAGGAATAGASALAQEPNPVETPQRRTQQTGAAPGGQVRGGAGSQQQQQSTARPPQPQPAAPGRGAPPQTQRTRLQPTVPQSTPQQQSGYRLPHQGGTAAGPSSQAAPGASAESRARASFPHAFERWETLSAHWEGLTSFWIRRLEQNAAEIDRDPLAQQLTRQVNDLSAAGANLFHAVVELQRLRASSERKFLRWFVETRNELERNQEMTAMLEAALEEERQSRAEAINAAVEQERSNSKVQKKLEEMRKELAISKEEARRAWEELGRREQEERDRTVSLQSGLPTLVGGVQVVPMAHGVPSRHASGRESRSHAEPSDYGAEYTQAPPVQPATYHQQGPETVGSYGSEAGYSEGEYAIDDQGNFIRDSQGRKVLFRATAAGGGAGPSSSGRLPGTGSAEEAESESGAEEYETPASQGGPPYPPAPAAPPAPTNPAHLHPQWAGTYNPANPEYTGQGFPQPGWESMPRHHHPTRLSDVLEEEEERSRTSASQVSRP